MALTRSLPGVDRQNIFVSADSDSVKPVSVEQVAMDHYMHKYGLSQGTVCRASVLL